MITFLDVLSSPFEEQMDERLPRRGASVTPSGVSTAARKGADILHRPLAMGANLSISSPFRANDADRLIGWITLVVGRCRSMGASSGPTGSPVAITITAGLPAGDWPVETRI